MPASPILLIAAEPVAAEAIESVLVGAGYAVTTTPEASKAISDGADYHLVVLDVVIGSMSAAEVLIRHSPSGHPSVV